MTITPKTYISEMKEKKLVFINNPAICILLCTEADKTIAKYSVLSENKQLFAAKHLPYLPTEEEFVTEIERQKEILKIQVSEKHP